jgi:hypothetical protein
MMGKNKKNTGTAYEVLVQAIFQAINNQEQVPNLVVERNKTLHGRATAHQIDVYWKFEKAGIPYETIVQAKDWQSPVKQGQLTEFKGVLDDLPGTRGVFVTRTGYQKGARDFAAAYKIILYELREPPPKKNITMTTLGWGIFTPELRSFKVPSVDPKEGSVEQLSMGLKATIFEPRYSNFAVQIDSAWFTSNPATTKIDKSSLTLRPLPIFEVNLYDQNELPVKTMEAIVRQEIDVLKGEKLSHKRVEHIFDTPTFLGPDSTGELFIKINKISFDLDVEVTERPPHFNLDGFVRLILREIPSQKERNFIARKTEP